MKVVLHESQFVISTIVKFILYIALLQSICFRLKLKSWWSFMLSIGTLAGKGNPKFCVWTYSFERDVEYKRFNGSYHNLFLKIEIYGWKPLLYLSLYIQLSMSLFSKKKKLSMSWTSPLFYPKGWPMSKPNKTLGLSNPNRVTL